MVGWFCWAVGRSICQKRREVTPSCYAPIGALVPFLPHWIHRPDLQEFWIFSRWKNTIDIRRWHWLLTAFFKGTKAQTIYSRLSILFSVSFLRPDLLPNLDMKTTFARFLELMIRKARSKPGLSRAHWLHHYFPLLNLINNDCFFHE